MDTELNIIANEHNITNPLIKTTINVSDLDKLDTIYNKIFIGDLLNYIEISSYLPIIQKIKTKLIKDGELVIEEFDQYEICLGVINDIINSIQYNDIIRPRKQILDTIDITDILTRSGFKITKKDIDGLRHCIYAK